MSHQVEIALKINDLEALRLACRELKIELKTGTGLQARTYNGSIQADAVIVLPSEYDVALHRQKDGTYKMEVDYYARWGQKSATEFIGENGKKLTQLYGVCKTELTARRLGHSVSRQVLKNGSINVLITGARL